MARVNRQHQLIMMRRRVPGLDAYLDRVTLLLWPKFKSLFDAQLSALRALPEKQLIAQGTEPSFVIRRYGVLLTSLLLMNAEHNDSVLHEAVASLHRAVLPAL